MTHQLQTLLMGTHTFRYCKLDAEREERKRERERERESERERERERDRERQTHAHTYTHSYKGHGIQINPAGSCSTHTDVVASTLVYN